MAPLIVKGDIVTQKVDAIVNAWNRNLIPWWLLLPQGVSGALKKHAGTKPFRELRRAGMIPLGGAVITSPGKLPVKALIHVAAINLLWRASEKSIRSSVTNALELVEAHRFASVAFPVLGAGSGGYDHASALRIMEDQIGLEPHRAEVRIVVFDVEAPETRHPCS